MMDEQCVNVCATSIPDEVLNSVSEVAKLSSAELTSTAIPSLLKRYGRKLSNFVHKSRPGVVCTRFESFNWDQHLGEELYYALLSIPVETLSLRSYPTDVLVTVGWTVLAVYHLDCASNSTWLHSLVKELLKSKGTNEKANYFLRALWTVEHCDKLPLSLLEEIALLLPFVIEKLVDDLIENLSTTPKESFVSYLTDDVFQQSKVNSWIKLCASSPKIFQISASVINSFLLLSRGELFVVMFVQQFHKTVNKLCDGNIVNLYPLYLQKIAMFLSIKPNVFNPAGFPRDVTVKNVFEPLLEGLVSDRTAYLCLLSHFPEWIPHLLQYSIEIGQARIVSKRLLPVDYQ